MLDYLEPFAEPKDSLYFGVELEVQTENSINKVIPHIRKTMPDFVICKRDGSIGDQGIEIVTVPASFYDQKKMWEGFFANKPLVTSWASGQCGMHVHIARKGLSILRIGKISVFINSPVNSEFISAIAGRSGNNYNRFRDRSISECNSLHDASRAAVPATAYNRQGQADVRSRIYRNASERRGTMNHDNHYEAVNLLPNNTIEVRIFRGTVKKEGFFKNLEFVHALVKFCEVAKIEDLTYPEFISWLLKNPKDYPHLLSYLRVTKSKLSKAAFAPPDPKAVKDVDYSKITDPAVIKVLKEKEKFLVAALAAEE